MKLHKVHKRNSKQPRPAPGHLSSLLEGAHKLHTSFTKVRKVHRRPRKGPGQRSLSPVFYLDKKNIKLARDYNILIFLPGAALILLVTGSRTQVNLNANSASSRSFVAADLITLISPGLTLVTLVTLVTRAFLLLLLFIFCDGLFYDFKWKIFLQN